MGKRNNDHAAAAATDQSQSSATQAQQPKQQAQSDGHPKPQTELGPQQHGRPKSHPPPPSSSSSVPQPEKNKSSASSGTAASAPSKDAVAHQNTDADMPDRDDAPEGGSLDDPEYVKKTIISQNPGLFNKVATSEKYGADVELERVRRKWQLASCAHFLEVFRSVLPLKHISVDTAEDLTPYMLEQAIVNPGSHLDACLALRDVIQALLIVLEEATLKNVGETWFQSLSMFVDSRPESFLDCFDASSAVGTGVTGGINETSVNDTGGNVNMNGHRHDSNGGETANANGMLKDPQSLLRAYTDGLQFLVSVTWNIRLGLLLSLCDIAAEESPVIRAFVRDAETAKPEASAQHHHANTHSTAASHPAQQPGGTSDTMAKVNGTIDSATRLNGVGPGTSTTNNPTGGVGLTSSNHHMQTNQTTTCPLEERGIRLRPLGRCSRKRSFYNVGKTRIYSGYRRKGSGALVVECSDSESMLKLVEALEAEKHPRDLQLAQDVRQKLLAPLLVIEERKERKLERQRQEELDREENRRRNSHRPRRKKASYA